MSFSAPPHDEMAELRRWSSLVIVHSWKNQTSLFVRKMALRRLTKSYIFVSSTYISKMSFRARLHNKSAESRRWLSSIWCNLGKIKYRCFREERRFAAPCCQKSYRKWNIYQRWARENAPGGRYERAKWRGQLETSQLILIITWHKPNWRGANCIESSFSNLTKNIRPPGLKRTLRSMVTIRTVFVFVHILIRFWPRLLCFSGSRCVMCDL